MNPYLHDTYKGYPDRKLPDSECLKIIQKTIKEVEEERISLANAGREESVKELQYQKEVIEKYLPKQLSEDEIRNIIHEDAIPYLEGKKSRTVCEAR